MTAVPDDAFAQSIAAYQSKDFIKAAGYCRALLLVQPDHAACLHLLGVIEHSLGHGDEAEALIRKSLSLTPGFAEMHFSFAQILTSRGKHAEAIMHYQKTLEIKPDHTGALSSLGKAFNNLGALLCNEGRLSESAKCFEQALIIKPDFPEALNNLGVVLFEQGLYNEAILHCEHALDLKPDYASALNNLGNARKAQGEWNEAIACYRHALTIDPTLTQARNNLGLVLLYGTFDSEGAAQCFREILKDHPDYVPALTHLGITHCLEGSYEEGILLYEKALKVRPDYRDALNNLGNALRATGKVAQSIEKYEQVVSLKPEDPEGHNNLAMAYLMEGRFKEGWSEYEWRWKTGQLKDAMRDFLVPQWRGKDGQGEDIKGKTLLIHAEQGFGDSLQFCRYIPMVKSLGMKPILEVQPELVRLMSSLAGVEKVIQRGQALPSFDLHCPMMSLPLAFKTTLETIPHAIPYLSVDRKLASLWRNRLSAAKDVKKIGIVWTGNPRLFSLDLAAANKRRSIPLDDLEGLRNLEKVQFYNLQKDVGLLPPNLGLIDYMSECQDFADTAALIVNLDLVLSVDTAVAHLAGALGKEVWLLNRFDMCWRWMGTRPTSPWYPSMRVFTQPKSGDWQTVIEKVREALS